MNFPRDTRDESPTLGKRSRDIISDLDTEYRAPKRLKLGIRPAEPPGLPKCRLRSGDCSPTSREAPRITSLRKLWEEELVEDEEEQFLSDDNNIEPDVWPSSPFYNDIVLNKGPVGTPTPFTPTSFSPGTPKMLEDFDDMLGMGSIIDEDEDDDEDEDEKARSRRLSRGTIHLDLSDEENDDDNDKVFVTGLLEKEEEEEDIFIPPPPSIRKIPRRIIFPNNNNMKKNNNIQINSPFYLHTPSKKYETMMNSPDHRPKIRIGMSFQAEIPPLPKDPLTPETRRRKRCQSAELDLLARQQRQLYNSDDHKHNRLRGGELYFDGLSIASTYEFEQYMFQAKRIMTSVHELPEEGTPHDDEDEEEIEPAVCFTELLVDILKIHGNNFGRSLQYVQKNVEYLKRRRGQDRKNSKEFCEEELWW